MRLINRVTVKVVCYDKMLYLEWIKFNAIFFGQDFLSAKIGFGEYIFGAIVLIHFIHVQRLIEVE